MSVYHAITGMCPRNATDVRVEGMEPVDSPHINYMQYHQRFRAWRTQFIRCKNEQRREAERDKKQKRGASDEVEEVEAPDNTELYDGDGLPVPDVELVSIAGRYNGAGEGAYTTACLHRTSDSFNEYGNAALPYCPGWIYSYDEESNTAHDCIPRGLACMHCDYSSLTRHMGRIIEQNDLADFQVAQLFGSLPANVLSILEERTFLGDNPEDIMVDDGGCKKGVSFQGRMDMYDRNKNPLTGYLHDRSNESGYLGFLSRLMAQPSNSNTIVQYKSYVDKAVHKTGTDITSGKMHGQVFDSTFKYLNSLDTELPGKIRNVFDTYREANCVKTGSDFEIMHGIHDGIFTHINAANMKLKPQNLFLLINLYLSEILWRCGTLGNWLWIGMTVQVSDAGGLTVPTVGKGCELTNYKKVGTCGYDFTRTMHTTLWNMYKYVVPRYVLDPLEGSDGQSVLSMMPVTPGAVGKGMITIVNCDVVKVPPETLGSMQVFPEGFGDNVDVIDMVLKTVPRDDNIRFKIESTCDPAKTGIRARTIYQSIPGFTNTILTFAENQQANADVRSKEDFGRVITTIPSSGQCEREARGKSRRSAIKRPVVIMGTDRSKNKRKTDPGVKFTDKQNQELGPFFSMAPMIAMRAALVQKLGIIRWDIGDPVDAVVQFTYQQITTSIHCMLSPLRIEHAVRYFGSSVAMAGVSRTLWMRTLARCDDEEMKTVDDVVKAVVCEQHADALHYSLTPSVMMRYLTSTLDYQTLVVMHRLMDYAKIPAVSTETAMAFIRGYEIPSESERDAIRAFIDSGITNGTFGRQTDGKAYGNFSEDSNMSYYVTSQTGGTRNPMRTLYVAAETNNRDPEAFKRDRLKDICATALKKDVVEYAKFCKVRPATPIDAAIAQMLTTEYELGGFLGGSELLGKPREMFRTLFDDQERFAGLPDIEPNRAMLKVIEIGRYIAFALNFPSALLMRSLMGDAGCDWELQVTVAKNLTTHFIANNVPYSLLPSDNLMMDSYVSNDVVSQLKVQVPRKMRPLALPRGTDEVFAGVSTNAKGGRSGPMGMIEDVAHMHSIYYLANEGHYTDPTRMDLNVWEVDVWWGNPGDITPLQAYTSHVEVDDETFIPSEGKRAYVKVERDNSLTLHVRAPGGEVNSVSLPTDKNKTRMSAQRALFKIGWGPAPKWQRTDVLFEHNGVLCTLVPHNISVVNDEVMLRDGFNNCPWFDEEEFAYLAHKPGDDVDLVGVEDILRAPVRYGAPLLVKASSPGFPEGTVFGPSDTHSEWVQGYLVSDCTAPPCFGRVAIAVRGGGNEGGAGTFHFPVDDIRAYVDNDDFHTHYRWATDQGV